MLIKYIVPEDGDDQAHPNVFKITTPQPPTLGQLKKAFPLPGKYHFRCLRSINNMTVWMDTTDDNAVLVAFEGAIFLKASRIGESIMRQQQPSSSSTTTATASDSNNNRRVSLGERLLQFSGDENDHAHATSSFLEPDNSTSDDLIGLHSPLEMASSGVTAAALASQSSSSSSHVKPPSSSGSNLDLFGIDSLQPTIVNSNTTPMGGGNNSNHGRAGGGLGMVGGMTSHNSGTGLSQPQQPAMRSSSMPVPNQAMGSLGRFPGQGQGQGGGMMVGGGVQGMNMNINGMGLPFNGIQHPMGGGGGGAMGPMGGMQQQKPQGQGLGQGGQMQFDAFSGMRPTGMQQQQQPPSNPNNPQQQNPRRF